MSSSASRHGQTIPYDMAAPLTRRSLLAATALGVTAGARSAVAAPQGQLTYGVHVSLAPSWFDPGANAGIITPYMLIYALHDALLKAMPDNKQAPSLAESFTASEDGLTYEFVLRRGATFHNGDPVTSDDVKFSFERYRGASQSLMKQRVAAVETPDAQHVRFKLKEAWPDFLTFYAGVSVPPGSCRANTCLKSVMTDSRRRRSVPDPIASSRSPLAWNWYWRRSMATGASRRRSSAWS
jgi:peptide/nickel transport system substrate-binding protein